MSERKFGKLPAVLRIYRDALITDMKAAIKTTVAELLPVLVARPLDSDLVAGERAVDSDGGGLSLASKLRNLSSESFVQLLAAIFKVIEAHLMQAAEVKKVIEWIMGNLDGMLSKLHYSKERQTMVPVQIRPKISAISFSADVLRENTEAVFAACDAAHGRWAKLLGVRALLHPRLRLQEFLSIYNITQDFIAATEKIGGRLGYSIRGTLQSQSKAFVDFQHESRMTKIKAVLDQETWVTVDVPDEFQSIVVSLSSIDNGELGPDILSSEMVESGVSSGEQHFRINESGEHVPNPSNRTSPPSSNQENRAEPTPSVRNDDSNVKEHGRSTSQTLIYGGIGYHMVNCGLILLKMLSEYVDISKCLPALSSEVVHRVVEILKLFNTRTCQLVLGAGAMQVSGLKSITSKHLALASQIISFIYAIIPDIRRVLFSKIPEARKALLMSEIDRVAQDYKIHRDEIHTKLVQIMRERLLANLRKLPQIVESWNAPEDNDLQPSQFARSVTKEVLYLHRILSQTLLEVDVQAIFR
ncbi:putative Vacuolar protein sorting-associated protein 54, chloroplastic [Cocos nucifera]|uniref:Putative Vacuolar protein sorting-associated protein 54, chloroplastic n=1 Tax=Cocos nucifera TaxID=13894 RepID=A0A8K0N7Z0_COCNU|nr:putative Vacuolar protein sorting-associated protein 54, chloroplastic [Cocos nucifera]